MGGDALRRSPDVVVGERLHAKLANAAAPVRDRVAGTRPSGRDMRA